MNATKIVEHLYSISLGFVNVFLIQGEHSLTLIDTGMPGSAPKILAAVAELGRKPADVQNILLSHLHYDHTGSARELQAQTGAALWMHALDAAALQQGQIMRPVVAGPGLVNRLARAAMARSKPQPAAPLEVQHTLSGGEQLDFARGLRVLHTPGHTSGHLSFLWPHDGGVLITGDSCGNMLGRLRFSPIYEDLQQGQRTLAGLADLPFQTAVFSHGRPLHDAAQRFRALWG